MKKEVLLGILLLGVGTCCAQGLAKSGEIVLSASKLYKTAHGLTLQNIAVVQQVRAQAIASVIAENLTGAQLLVEIEKIDASYIPVLAAMDVQSVNQFKMYGASIYKERPLGLLPSKDSKIPQMWKSIVPTKNKDISLKEFEPWLSSIQTDVENVPEDVNAAITYLKEVLLGEGAQTVESLGKKGSILQRIEASPRLNETTLKKIEEKNYSLTRQNFEASREVAQLMADLVDLLKTSPNAYKGDLIKLVELLNKMPQTEFVKYLKEKIPYKGYTPIAGFR